MMRRIMIRRIRHQTYWGSPGLRANFEPGRPTGGIAYFSCRTEKLAKTDRRQIVFSYLV